LAQLNKVISAVILAGGLGKRLRPVLPDRPKALAPIGARVFLSYLLDQIAEAGMPKAVLCTGFLGEQVGAALGDRYRGLRLLYSREPEPLGTAGALRLALPLLESDPVLVLNGDSFCRLDISAFYACHLARRAKATIALVQVPDVSRFGAVNFSDDGCIRGFGEKSKQGAGWINAGIYLLSRKLLEAIPAGRAVSLERQVFPAWVGKGLYGYPGGQSFIDIGTPDSYREAASFLSSVGRAISQPEPSHTGKAEGPGTRRFVVLDRDGTVNAERNYLSDPEVVELLPHAAHGLKLMQDLGLGLVIVTNQSAIGRGYFNDGRLGEIHERLRTLLAKEDVSLDGIYYCPHTPEEGCNCRKPAPGLVYRAAAELGFDPQRAFLIGDKKCDVELGRAVGAKTFLVRTGYGAQVASGNGATPDYVVDDLFEAAVLIKELVKSSQERRS
jgi:histidinol-phosphate phosphatase family protein